MNDKIKSDQSCLVLIGLDFFFGLCYTVFGKIFTQEKYDEKTDKKSRNDLTDFFVDRSFLLPSR